MAVAIGLDIGHLAVADDSQHSARNLTSIDGCLDGGVCIVEEGRAHPYGFWGRTLERLCLHQHGEAENKGEKGSTSHGGF